MTAPVLTKRIRYDTGQNFFWDDDRFPALGAGLDNASGRIDYDFTECAVGYQANARYPNEPLCIAAQNSHKWMLRTEVRPHLHWVQAQAAVPNWLMQYRIWENGAVKPAWVLQAYDATVFTYPGAGEICQITTFPNIDMSAVDSVSCFIDIRIFRDSANTSTLFAGADPVATVVLLKEYDHHRPEDGPGSVTEFRKT